VGVLRLRALPVESVVRSEDAGVWDVFDGFLKVGLFFDDDVTLGGAFLGDIMEDATLDDDTLDDDTLDDETLLENDTLGITAGSRTTRPCATAGTGAVFAHSAKERERIIKKARLENMVAKLRS